MLINTIIYNLDVTKETQEDLGNNRDDTMKKLFENSISTLAYVKRLEGKTLQAR